MSTETDPGWERYIPIFLRGKDVIIAGVRD